MNGYPHTFLNNASSYRYAFNGMEKDDEVKGEGNSYDFGARMYDPRVGRWLSTDMYESHFPDLSPYVYAVNNPIFILDPDGNIPWPVFKSWVNNDNKTVFRKLGSRFKTKSRPGHNGVDINMGSGNDDLGAPVRATHSGRIIAVKSYKDRDGGGNRIYIQSKDGSIQTWYLHLDEFAEGIEVGKTGALIEEGQLIGYIGGSGKGAQTGKVDVHLHYEIRKKKNGKFEPIDPVNKDGELIDPQTELLGLTSSEYSSTPNTSAIPNSGVKENPNVQKINSLKEEISSNNSLIQLHEEMKSEMVNKNTVSNTIQKTIDGLKARNQNLQNQINELESK